MQNRQSKKIMPVKMHKYNEKYKKNINFCLQNILNLIYLIHRKNKRHNNC